MQQAPVKKKKKIRVPRVINGIETMVEVEVDEDAGPGWGPNDKHKLLNHHVARVEGPLKEFRFAGAPVVAVAATTPEIAEDALRAMVVGYEVLPHTVNADDAIKPRAPKVLPDDP